MKTKTFPASFFSKQITMDLKITGIRRWVFRMKVGLWVVRLGVKIMGLGCRIELPENWGKER